MKIEVKNLNGTADRRPKNFDSWKDFWKFKAWLTWPSKCVCCGKNKAVLGGHVHTLRDNRHFIVPMCASCNNQSSDTVFAVEERYMVPVNDKD